MDLLDITGYKKTLDSLSEKVNGEVTIGDNSAHSVEGIGNCTLKLKLGNTLLLKGVLQVPWIKRNLISIATLEDDGHNVAFVDHKVLKFRCPNLLCHISFESSAS